MELITPGLLGFVGAGVLRAHEDKNIPAVDEKPAAALAQHSLGLDLLNQGYSGSDSN